jgi:hypothetical protein
MAEKKIGRGLYFDDYLKVVLELLWMLDALSHDYQGAWFKGSGDRDNDRSTVIRVMGHLFSLQESELDQFVATQKNRPQLASTLHLISEFLIVGIIEFIKCFDALKEEDDPENYYMEREWRVPRNIQFKLSDVERIIIPRKFVAAFRADVPDYNGQLHFVD